MRKFAADLWIGLRTGPARAGLALLSLALGLFAVTILLSTLAALQRQARDLVQSFGAGSFLLIHSGTTPAPVPWNRRHVQYFRDNLGEAAAVSGVKQLASPPGTDFALAATDAALARVRAWRFVAGRPLDEQDVRQGSRHAMASAAVCRQNGWRVGTVVSLGNEPFRLVGCYENGETPVPAVPDHAVYIPYSADVLETGGEDRRQRVDVLVFRTAADCEPEAVRRRVATLLSHPGSGAEGLEWITPESLLSGLRRWQRAIAWTAGAGGAMSLVLGAATLAGLLLTGVRERIPEIGLRRALGARPLEIARLFVAEALVLTGAAAVGGELAAEVLLRWLGGRFPLPYQFGAGTRMIPLGLACGIAILCSIGPAWLAARLPPAEALRNE